MSATEEKWFSLGYSGSCDSEETLVRMWTPGDGVRCAHASYQRKEPCGPPAAVVETVQFRYGGSGGYSPEYGVKKRTTRVVCAEHLAGRVVNIQTRSYQGRSKAIAEAVKKATDELVTEYWKQYQTLYRKHLDNELSDLMSNIPEPLKPLIAAGLEAADDSGEAVPA